MTIENLITLSDLEKFILEKNPKAKFSNAKGSILTYKVNISLGTPPARYSIFIFFEVPIADMGDTIFNDIMDSKNLIKYIVYDKFKKENKINQS